MDFAPSKQWKWPCITHLEDCRNRKPPTDSAEEAQNGNDLADRTSAPLNVKQGSKQQWLNSYFNPAAFVPNAIGTHGNSGRNMLRGPRGSNLDLAFLKNFPFYNDLYRLQLRWEMYNATNTPWFGTPDTNPTDTNYTKITGTQNSPRVMQFAAKFIW